MSDSSSNSCQSTRGNTLVHNCCACELDISRLLLDVAHEIVHFFDFVSIHRSHPTSRMQDTSITCSVRSMVMRQGRFRAQESP